MRVRLDENGEVGIGLVVPFDLALDREYWRWTPEHVSLHFTRTRYADTPVSVAMAEAVSDDSAVTEATRALAAVEPAVTVYACTSGSFVHGVAGEGRLRRAMEKAGARCPVTTSGALLEALAALAARRVAVGTPYDSDVTLRLESFLAEAGYETTSTSSLGLTGRIWRVSYRTVVELAEAVDHRDADVLFLSCTNLRTFDVLSELEHRLGKPVLSANQVTMWAALARVDALPMNLDQELFRLERYRPSVL